MSGFRRGAGVAEEIHERNERRRKQGVGVFEAVYLPDSEKERLCRSLLAELGVAHVRPSGDGELIHPCLLPFSEHKDQDRNPTASLNYKKLTYNCLSGDTLVKTFDGDRPISELAGGVHRLLDATGKWVEAPVRQYGIERLYRVTLSRNGVRKAVYATANHRWYVRPRNKANLSLSALVEKTTLDLSPNHHRIPSIWPMNRVGRTTLSRIGVMAGFVFGDGTQTVHGARANFCGEKDEALLPYFEGMDVRVRGDNGLKQIINGLPRSWRDLPSLDEGASYLYGWLAGYFAADGCVADDGHITISCRDPEVLRTVVTICDRLGIGTYTLNSRDRQGYGDGPSNVSTLSFRNSTLIPEFFLIPAHRERYRRAGASRTFERTHWTVVSVEETDRVEPVFCAEVETTHSFVLAGNLLTGNCFGCGAGGGLLWFLGMCRDEDGEAARKWLEGQTGSGPDEQSLSSLMEYFDAIYEQRRTTVPVIPRMDAKVLDPWLALHPYMTDPKPDGRGISEETLMRFMVGYGEIRTRVTDLDLPPGADEYIASHRIVIPHFWKGTLVGWQTRRLMNDGTPKYVSSPDFPKETTIYNYEPKRRVVVGVESPMSVLSKAHLTDSGAPHIEGTFGAKVTDRQVRLMSMHPKVILFFDNDEAGWNATKQVADRLEGLSDVWVANNPWRADPADLDDAAYLSCIEDPIPYALWRPPAEEELVRWAA